jgi:hypothetical protein
MLSQAWLEEQPQSLLFVSCLGYLKFKKKNKQTNKQKQTDPLNVIRTRLQLTDSKQMDSMVTLGVKMLKDEGISSMFTGWQAQVIALAASNFVYFYQYNGLKAMVQKIAVRQGKPKDLSVNMNLVIATVAGVINVLTTTPLWVVSTRLSVQRTGGSTLSSYKGLRRKTSLFFVMFLFLIV